MFTKLFAFISYSSSDTEWGKKLQRKLESYRLPSTLCREWGWKRTPIRPVFFAPTDIQPEGLSEELKERLRASRNLIVICSPNSAKSEWVGKEIEFFHSLGRPKQILSFIVDGILHSGNPDTECFNPIIRQLGIPEILGANIHERVYRWPWMNKERAYVQKVSKLLGLEFDAIWQRHKRMLIQKTVAWAIRIIVVLAAFAGVWINSRPVDVEVRLNEVSVHNENLPPFEDAIVTMSLENEDKTDTIHSLNDAITFANILHRFLNKEVRVKIICKNYLPVDTTLLLSETVSINIRRNPDVYGSISFRLVNSDTFQPAGNAEVIIDGNPVKSDADGLVTLYVPLERQDTIYNVTSSTINLIDSIVVMPYGQDDIIRFR